MSTPTPAVGEVVAKLKIILPVLGSPVEGEREAAAHSVYRVLTAKGLSGSDLLPLLAQPPQTHPGQSSHDVAAAQQAWWAERQRRQAADAEAEASRRRQAAEDRRRDAAADAAAAAVSRARQDAECERPSKQSRRRAKRAANKAAWTERAGGKAKAPPPQSEPWRNHLKVALDSFGRLPPKDATFVAGIRDRAKNPAFKPSKLQATWLADVAGRVVGAPF